MQSGHAYVERAEGTACWSLPHHAQAHEHLQHRLGMPCAAGWQQGTGKRPSWVVCNSTTTCPLLSFSGLQPSEIFFYLFLPPLLLDSAVRVDFYVFRK